MITTANSKKLYASQVSFVELDAEALNTAKKRFNEYQKQKVIKDNCLFSDNIWKATDEYESTGIYFDINTFNYSRWEKVFCMNKLDFILKAKTFVMSIFGKNVLRTIHCLLTDIHKIFECSPEEFFDTDFEVSLNSPPICTDFFILIFNSYEDTNNYVSAFLEKLDYLTELNIRKNSSNQRLLSTFDSYLVFNDIMEDYWKSDISQEERLFYYPLFLWWKLTGVVPLRPREFLLTQRDCLTKDNQNNFYLRLQRNKLKGSKNRLVKYKISEDYSSEQYRIPQWLGSEIEKYLSLTEKFEKTSINTLFLLAPYDNYRSRKRNIKATGRYLNYVSMNQILRYFYEEIIVGKYFYTVTYASLYSHLDENEIGFIHLGDTRHISLINLMMEGGTPVTAMFLAGHTNELTAGHYYSNIKNLIECKTYRMYRKQLTGNEIFKITKLQNIPSNSNFKIMGNGGKCFSQAYLSGDISDCINSIGPNGEIGYCLNCINYRFALDSDSGTEYYLKQQLESDCNSLTHAINLVRKGKGCVEDIGQELLKLQSSSVSYERYLLEKKYGNQEN